MLSFVGQSPVNVLTNTRADVRIAQNLLTETSRTIQSIGWNFNTEYNVTLSKDGNDNIPVSNTLIRFDLNPEYRASVRVAIRGDKLRDLKNATDTFTVALLKGTCIYNLAFSDLPEVVKHYVTIQAAIDFKSTTQGNDAVTRIDLDRLARARATAENADAVSGNYNIFDITNKDQYRKYTD